MTNYNLQLKLFHGWSNYETWAIYQKLFGTDPSQTLQKELLEQAQSVSCFVPKTWARTSEEAVRFTLAKMLKDYIIETLDAIKQWRILEKKTADIEAKANGAVWTPELYSSICALHKATENNPLADTSTNLYKRIEDILMGTAIEEVNFTEIANKIIDDDVKYSTTGTRCVGFLFTEWDSATQKYSIPD